MTASAENAREKGGARALPKIDGWSDDDIAECLSALLEYLRGLPVAERMEAMWMERTEFTHYSDDVLVPCWVEGR